MKFSEIMLTLICVAGLAMFIGGFFAIASGVNSKIGFFIPLGGILTIAAAKKYDDLVNA